jgi:diguanylate cyclase (GGDEF)-like protein
MPPLPAPAAPAEYLIPAICCGLVLSGSAVFLFFYTKGREARDRALLILGALSFLIVLFDTLALAESGARPNIPANRLFHLLEQIAGFWFIVAIPLLLRQLYALPLPVARFNRLWAWSGGALALGLTLLAFLAPGPQVSRVGSTSVAATLLYALVVAIYFLGRQARRRDLIPIAVGFFLAFVGAASDLLWATTRIPLDPWRDLSFARLNLGVALFVFCAMGSAILRFIDRARELADSNETLHRLVYHDPLTNLPNRKAFRERLAETLAQARRSTAENQRAVLGLDIEGFRSINDNWGPEVGDEVLREVARRLRRVLREGDILARTGHDEFSIILTKIDREESASVAAMKLQTALGAPFQHEEKQIPLRAHIGIVSSPKDGQKADALIQKCERALQQAKNDQVPFQFFTESMQKEIVQRLRLTQRIRAGIDRGEFHLFWQPQVDGGGRIIGAEALVRWKTAEGWVAPNEFIPIAEETRLILPLGWQILRIACVQQRRWLDMGLSVPRLSVNLSPRQLRHENLVGLVNDIVAETDAVPGLLELEITESGVMEDRDGVREKILQLNERGIHFAIDDFGTGYSSLSYLQRFPVQVLKIDQSFVRQMENGEANARLVQAIIDLSRTFALDICAEGVETRGQADRLVALGCQRLQGFLFAKPVPVAEFTRMLSSRRALP